MNNFIPVQKVFACAFLALVVGFVLSTPLAAVAQCTGAAGFVPLECFEGSSLQGAYTEANFGNFMQKMFVGAISFGAIFAVFRIAWAGFLYIGSDLWTDKDKAKGIISDTLLGLFLLLAIWLILYQINPNMLNLNINITRPTIQSSGTTAAPAQQALPNQFTSPGGAP